jgi:hypothetical protein
MFTAVTVYGTPVGLSDPEAEIVSLEFGAGDGLEYRCRACGEDLTETAHGFVNDAGEATCRCADTDTASDEDSEAGLHDVERIPLSWCNSAKISADAEDDSVTVAISVGEPRGAFTMTIRRVPDDVDGPFAGQLVMHLPYAGQPSPHMELTHLHPGTLAVGPLRTVLAARSAGVL